MGVIAKQSIQGSVYLYIGAFLGFVNTGLLMPKFLSTEQVGLVNLLVAVSLIMSTLSSLGMNNVISRLFPYFRDDEKNHNGILGFLYLIVLAGVLISLILFLFFKDNLAAANAEKSELFADNLFYIPILFILPTFYSITDNFNKSLFDAVTGIFLRELLVRLLTLILIVAFIANLIDFEKFLFYYVIVYVSPLFIIIPILLYRKSFSLLHINFKLIAAYKKEIFLIALFGLIAGFSGTAVMNIDKYMINSYLGLSDTGVYSISFYFGAIILLPSRALKKISSIVIAEAWKDNDLETIKVVYIKSTINQLIVGIFIFMCVWINIDTIFEVLPNYEDGRYVILLIGGAYVIEMMSGVSDMIIVTSKHYKMFSWIMVLKIFFVIVLNILFIPIWGLTGGAFASFIAILLTVLLRYIFIVHYYNFQPYSIKHLLVFVFSCVSFVISYYFVPKLANIYIDLPVRTLCLLIIFGLLIVYGRISIDLNDFLKKVPLVSEIIPRK